MIFARADFVNVLWTVHRAELPDGTGLFIERFELLCWASTRDALIDKLS